jgi:uncharacterized protein (TIGR03435 family)
MQLPTVRSPLGASLLLIASHATLGQPSQPTPAFDVASIKESAAGDSLKGPVAAEVSFSPGSVNARNATIKDLLIAAYRVRDFQVSGPSIIGSGHYDIRARITDPASADLQRRMLQTLLADRFHLTLHRETRVLELYVLTAGKHPSFPKSKLEAESSLKVLGAAMLFLNYTMEKLAAFLSARGDRPVIDETGIEGQYDLTVQLADPDASIAEVKQALGRAVSDGSLPATVASQLGLKLERRKGPVEFLVVDHAEKASEN